MQKYFTKQGLKQLKQELERLKTIKRHEIAQRLRETADFGDLTENAAYQETKEAQAQLEAKIAELEDTIRNAIIAPEQRTSGVVEIGSQVTTKCGKDTFTFTIVGTLEGAPWDGKISIESPLGKALLNHRKHDEVEVGTPDGKKTHRILDIA